MARRKIIHPYSGRKQALQLYKRKRNTEIIEPCHNRDNDY